MRRRNHQHRFHYALQYSPKILVPSFAGHPAPKRLALSPPFASQDMQYNRNRSTSRKEGEAIAHERLAATSLAIRVETVNATVKNIIDSFQKCDLCGAAKE